MKSALLASTLLLGLALTACGDDQTTEAGPTTPSSTATPSATAPASKPSASTAPAATPEESGTTLTFSGASARCMRPIDQKYLKSADLAFEGKVASTTDGTVTIRVTRTFQGEPGKVVRMQSHEGTSVAVSFAKGENYLITASDGEIADCLSGSTRDTSLRESYDQAFGQ
ncbi:hypothetical protein [Kineosporia babensis]|uniref:Lipoprotein n=1 Tax=Kineosporia babensis TaxID=499548 RepID=A0A9X1SY26_9ACTN|nr:hypothetical protein [Kineosporia babensis]MCD5310663.1 hypothetical protein [Kineosporia babensis]